MIIHLLPGGSGLSIGVGQLNNSSTAAESSDPRETVRPNYQAVGSFSFRHRFTSFHTHSSLITFFFCYFVLFHSCFSNARVFEKKTLLHHEFHIYYPCSMVLVFLRHCNYTCTICIRFKKVEILVHTTYPEWPHRQIGCLAC